MAVTQQLVGIAHERLVKCSSDVRELERLIGFEIEEPEQEIDLNWSPSAIVRALKVIGANETAALVDMLFGEGAEILNEAHPKGPPNYFVYEPITYVSNETVLAVLSSLEGLSQAQVSQMISVAAEFGMDMEFSDLNSAQEYYREHFDNLFDFLQSAVGAKQCVVAWWD
ncbi:MAG: DUF1877 family protein [Pseudomonadota bacterium]